MIIPRNRFVLIIGAMKSGTTSLFDTLIKSPQICRSAIKEPEYFTKNNIEEIQFSDYCQLWDFDHKVHKWALEASTGYTKTPFHENVPKKIKQIDICPKLIYCVRNPFDRIVSQYHFNSNNPNFNNSPVVSEGKIALSRYYYQLSFYRKCFDKDNLLIVDFDQIKKAPQNVIDQICEFLDISKFKIRPKENKSKTPIRSKFENNIKARFYKYLKKMPSPMISFGLNITRRLVKAKKKELTKKEYKAIYNELYNDMIAFKKEYDFPVEKWGFK